MSDPTSAHADGIGLDADRLQALSRLQPWRSLGHVALVWASIALVIGLCEAVRRGPAGWAGFAPLYLLALVWIAGRQHALGVLLHEAVHRRLSRRPWLNDFIGEWLLAWPLQVSLAGYRRQHALHHRALGTNVDPDLMRMAAHPKYAFPKPRREIVRILAAHALGLTAWADGREAQEQLVRGIPRGLQAVRLALYAGLIAAAIRLDFWPGLVAYWLVPASTLLMLLLYIRLVGEHGAMRSGSGPFGTTRHVEPAAWERWFIAPLGVNHHLAHHLHPTVPFFRLPALHRALLEDPVYRDRARITRGYVRGLLFGECTRTLGP